MNDFPTKREIVAELVYANRRGRMAVDKCVTFMERNMLLEKAIEDIKLVCRGTLPPRAKLSRILSLCHLDGEDYVG